MKKILSFVLILTIVLSTLSIVSANEVAFQEYEYGADQINVIMQLGIIEKNQLDKNGDKYISRVEFAKILYKFANFNNPMEPSATKSYFTDVDLYHYAAGEIQYLVERGIVYGGDDGLYYADRNITANEAAVMILRTAGYGIFEKETHGSDPTISEKAKISKGLSGDITYKQAAQMLYNSLFIDCIITDNFNGSNLSYKHGDIVLHEVLQLGYYDGIVKSVGERSLTNKAYGEDTLVVDDMVFDNAIKCSPSLLGLKVKVFYGISDYGEYAVAIEKLSNTILTIDVMTYVDYSNNVIRYYTEDGKIRKVRLIPEKDVLFNSCVVDGIEGNIPTYGSIELRDGGSDGEYDVVMIHSFENGIVSSVNAVDETVRFKNRTSVKLSDYKTVEITDKNGIEVTISSLLEDNVVNIYSYEKEYLKLVVCSDTMTGNVDSMSVYDSNWPDIAMGETTYLMYPDYYSGSYTIRSGQEVTLLLDAYGRVAGVTPVKSDNWRIGYLLRVALSERTFDETVMFKILESDGNITIYESVERVVADGTKKYADDLLTHIDVAYNNFDDSDSNGKELVTTRIIRYFVNNDGLISKIDTPTRLALGTTMPTESLSENNQLLLRVKGNYYRSASRYIYQPVGENEINGTILPSSNNMAFIVPQATNTEPDEELDYRVTTMETLKKDKGEYYDLSGYNCGVNSLATDILVIRMDAGATDNFNVMLVDTCSHVLDEYDEISIQLKGLSGTAQTEYYVNEKKSSIDADSLNRGDVVSYTLENGRMILRELLYSKSGSGVLNTGSIYSTDGVKTLFSEFRVFSGEISRIDGEYAYVDIGDDAAMSDEVIILPNAVLIYDIDGGRGSVYLGDISSISTQQDGIADKVIVSMIKGSGANVRSVVVIKQ